MRVARTARAVGALGLLFGCSDLGGGGGVSDPHPLDRLHLEGSPVLLASRGRALVPSIPPTLTLTLVASVEPPVVGGAEVQANSVIIDGDFAFIGYNLAGEAYAGAIDVVDISVPDTPRLVSALLRPHADIHGVEVEGGVVYAAEASNTYPFPSTAAVETFPVSPLGIIDATESQLAPMSGYVTTSVRASGPYLFATSGTSGKLVRFQRAGLVEDARASVPRARDVDADGDRVVVLEGAPGNLRIYDRDTLALQAQHPVSGLDAAEARSSVQLVDGKAVISAGSEGVIVASLDDGRILGSHPTPDPAALGLEPAWVVTNAAQARGHDIVLAHGAAGVYWLRTQTPMFSSGSTTSVDLYELGKLIIDGFASANDIAFEGEHLILAAGREGTAIIRAVESCPAGYELVGIDCVDIDGCADAPCHPDTTCTDVPPPGTGYTCSQCIGPGCPELRAMAGPDVLSVRSATATISGAAEGFNGAYDCRWENDQTPDVFETCTATVAVDTVTTFTLTVTDASSAVAVDALTIYVAELVADAGVGQNTVSGDAVTLSAAVFGASCPDDSCLTCTWTETHGGAVVGTDCETEVSPTTTREYTLTVYDAGLGETATDSTTVFVTDQFTEVCHWQTIALPIDPVVGGAPNYACINGNTGRVQPLNADPSVVLSDLQVGNALIQGRLAVETTGDDDFIGFVWGWQDPRQHYVMRWKQRYQDLGRQGANRRNCGIAHEGIAVLRMDADPAEPATLTQTGSFFTADYVADCGVHWSSERFREPDFGGSTEFLLTPTDPGAFTQGWRDRITYRFDVYFTPTKTKFVIHEDDRDESPVAVKLTEFTVTDTAYPEGGLGFYTNSQNQTEFLDFNMASLTAYHAVAGPTREIGTGETVTLSGRAELAVPPYACTWSVDGVEISTDCEVNVAPTVPTTYDLTVVDDFGRIAEASTAVIVTAGP